MRQGTNRVRPLMRILRFGLQIFLHLNAYNLLVAREAAFDEILLRRFCKRAHERYDEHAREHRERPGVDRRLQNHRERVLKEDIERHEYRAEDEAAPYRGVAHALPVQAVEERREERARQSAPGYAHKLRYERDAARVLNHGDDRRNQAVYTPCREL